MTVEISQNLHYFVLYFHHYCVHQEVPGMDKKIIPIRGKAHVKFHFLMTSSTWDMYLKSKTKSESNFNLSYVCIDI